MADILVSKVGDTLDGTFLNSPLRFLILTHRELAHLESTLFIFGDDLLAVNLHLLHLESTAQNVKITTDVILQVGILGGSFPKPENIILLNIPS